MTGLRFHHVGVIVPSIDEALPIYLELHPASQQPFKTFVSSQGVNVCFVSVGDGTFIELIEEATKPSAISTLIKRGVTFYHLGYLTERFEESIELLEQRGYKTFDEFRSEAFENKRVRFCFSPVQHWIEVIEA